MAASGEEKKEAGALADSDGQRHSRGVSLIALSSAVTGADARARALTLEDHRGEIEVGRNVGIRFRVDQIAKIDTIEQRYEVRGVLWADWEASPEDIEAHKEDPIEWKPTFSPDIEFVNIIETEMDVFTFGNGSTYQISPGAHFWCKDKKYVWIRYDLKGVFTDGFECENYPFDVQDLTFLLQSVRDRLSGAAFVPIHHLDTAFVVDTTFWSESEWSLVTQVVEYTHIDWGKSCLAGGMDCPTAEIELYAAVFFRIQVKRSPEHVLKKTVTWIFALGVLSFGIKAIPTTDVADRLGYSMTLVLSMVAFQFILSDALPNLEYLTIVDMYNLCQFIFLFALTIETIVIGWNIDHDDPEPWRQDADQIGTFIFAAIFILFHIVFIWYVVGKMAFEKSKIGLTRKQIYKLLDQGEFIYKLHGVTPKYAVCERYLKYREKWDDPPPASLNDKLY